MMKNRFTIPFSFIFGSLIFLFYIVSEGKSDSNSRKVLYTIFNKEQIREGSEVYTIQNGEKSKKTYFDLSAIMKHLIPSSFNESPVIMNTYLYSTISATWTGAVSTNWNNTGNWMDGVIPTAFDIVMIPNVTNAPVIMNGTNAMAQSVFIDENASLTISTTGSLSLEGATGSPSGGIHNLGSLTNNGSIRIGQNISPGQYGLVNEGLFQNNGSGILNVNRTGLIGIWNRSSISMIINSGRIVCGDLANIGEGLNNEGSIQNNGGELELDRFSGSAINNRPNANIQNSGKIVIGKTEVQFGTGLYNFGQVVNHSNGEIRVDRTNSGIFNTTSNGSSSALINEGGIFIGQIAGIVGPGIYNNRIANDSILFENKSGGQIFIDRTNACIHNGTNCTILNDGLINIGQIGEFQSSSLGIYNEGKLSNFFGGEIKIDKVPRAGIHHRSGTLTNDGTVLVGITTLNSNFSPGVYLDGAFVNGSNGELHIDQFTRLGLYLTSSNTLTNSGVISIGQQETGGGIGFFIAGSAVNLQSGEITISNIPEEIGSSSMYITSSGAMNNQGSISAGLIGKGGSIGFFNNGSVINSGEISIDNISGTFGRTGLINNNGSFNNNGKISLGDFGDVGDWGIYSLVTFNNQSEGEIRINRCDVSGIRNGSLGFGGTFTNEGKISIGEDSPAGDWGIWNDSPFVNSGILSISKSSVTALRNQSNTFTNSGKIELGNNGSAGQWGLWNQAVFNNQSQGELFIDNTSDTGLLIFSNSFNNNGYVAIGKNHPTGEQAIYVSGTLTNNDCAEIHIYDPIKNENTITNSGLMVVNTSEMHTNVGFTNNGVIVYPQGNPISNVTNAQTIIGPKTDMDCQNIATGFDIVGADFSILGIYFDSDGTQSAGSYNMVTNVFTASPPFENGVYVLYVELMDLEENCKFIVPWQLTGENCCNLPVANCQPFEAALNQEGTVTINANQIDNGSTADCGLDTITLSPNIFDCSHVGMSQLVTLTITDIRGTSSTCTTNITVIDTLKPMISCPIAQTLILGNDCTAMIPDYTGLVTVIENCAVQSVIQTPEAGQMVSNAGNLPITIKVTDVNNNFSECTFSVTKLDNTPPTLTCFDQTIVFNGEMAIDLNVDDLAEADDNCALAGIALSQTSVSPDEIGQTIPVLINATDVNGNAASCVSQIMVTGLPRGWSQAPNGIGCANGNDIDYNPTTQIWTATSTNCFYSTPFTNDAAAFAQRTLCGNGSITAQVIGISGTSLGWAGVVMRESNATGAKKAQLTTNLGNFLRREFRTITGGQSMPQQFLGPNRHWLRLTRSGSQFAMFTSSDGVNWSFVGAQNIQMDNCIQIGLVSTNYSSNSTVTASFANVSFTDSQQLQSGHQLELLDARKSEMSSVYNDFKIFPNPTSGVVNFNFIGYDGKAGLVEVYSTLGKLLLLKEIDSLQDGNDLIDLSGYANGIYFIRVSAEGLPTIMKRLVVSSS